MNNQNVFSFTIYRSIISRLRCKPNDSVENLQHSFTSSAQCSIKITAAGTMQQSISLALLPSFASRQNSMARWASASNTKPRRLHNFTSRSNILPPHAAVRQRKHSRREAQLLPRHSSATRVSCSSTRVSPRRSTLRCSPRRSRRSSLSSQRRTRRTVPMTTCALRNSWRTSNVCCATPPTRSCTCTRSCSSRASNSPRKRSNEARTSSRPSSSRTARHGRRSRSRSAPRHFGLPLLLPFGR